ncbi:hypothetical protein V6N13_132002 [Hibiscus sabdariffa]
MTPSHTRLTEKPCIRGGERLRRRILPRDLGWRKGTAFKIAAKVVVLSLDRLCLKRGWSWSPFCNNQKILMIIVSVKWRNSMQAGIRLHQM